MHHYQAVRLLLAKEPVVHGPGQRYTHVEIDIDKPRIGCIQVKLCKNAGQQVDLPSVTPVAPGIESKIFSDPDFSDVCIGPFKM